MKAGSASYQRGGPPARQLQPPTARSPRGRDSADSRDGTAEASEDGDGSPPGRSPSPGMARDESFVGIPRHLPSARHSITRREIWKGLANRILYSRAYATLYVVMALLSVATIYLASTEKCPSITFVTFEVLINLSMIFEIAIRMTALGRLFWKSIWNVFDLAVLVFCVVTLAVMTATRPLAHQTDCNPDSWSEKEEVLDLFMIIVRNVAQGVRMLFMLRKNRQNIFSRPQNVDLSATQGLLAGHMPAIDVVPSSLPSNGYGRTVVFEDDEDDFDM
ncbi:hypothetical protein DFJ74DRAFT_663221 [Hyaloraphidium curvatum]|nr:hypothetical protein DFJ74DRAFT_663221 [Hyaloraphidium curvatum]